VLFEFKAYSALLLPFVVPGLALAGHLFVRATRTSTLADGLLGLLLLLNVLPVAQWMLGFAGWYDSHDAYSTAMFYVPWRPWLAWGPVLRFGLAPFDLAPAEPRPGPARRPRPPSHRRIPARSRAAPCPHSLVLVPFSSCLSKN